MKYIPIVPLNEGDWIQLGVSVWSPEGLVDLSSIEWLSLNVKERPALKYNFEPGVSSTDLKKDLRICDLEFKTYWSVVPQDPREQLLPMKFLAPCFKRIKFKSSGLECVSVKGIYQAVQTGKQPRLLSPGVLPQSFFHLACFGLIILVF